jgi:hypothetical protein
MTEIVYEDDAANDLKYDLVGRDSGQYGRRHG